MEDIVSTAVPATARPARFSETIWFNALWFQSTWFCTVLGRDSLLPLAVAMIVLHLALVRDVWRELLPLSTIAAIGISVDATLSYTGVFQFSGGVLVPLWLCCLWLAFATTLTRSLAWLGSRRGWAAAAGFLVIPLNYWAGQRLGAVTFPQPLGITLGIMAVTWAVMLPCIYRISSLLTQADRTTEEA